MKIIYFLGVTLLVLIIIFSLTLLFKSLLESDNVDRIYANVCDRGRTYYSLENTKFPGNLTESLTFSGDDEQCKKLCAYSPKCVGYLTDGTTCNFFENSNIGEETSIKYSCEYPTRKFYNNTFNNDGWRWGEWKKDYPFFNSVTKENKNLWDVCNGKPSYWYFDGSSLDRQGIYVVTDSKSCNDLCYSMDDECIGWEFVPVDTEGKLNNCNIYNGVKDMRPETFTHTCEVPGSASAYNLGGWKVKFIPPEYI